MIDFLNDRKNFPFGDSIHEKELLRTQIFQIIQELTEEDLYYYLEILKLTVRTND